MDELIAIFREHGSKDYIGEAVTQEEHACQAAKFAMDAGADDDTVLGALFHDIGHLIALGDDSIKQMDGNLGAEGHERIGASFLISLGFSHKTAELVKRHVDAKRYLCWKNPAYFKKLSEASKGTLKCQGGPMEEEEALAFEKDPLMDTIIKMRTWDEAAKVVNPTWEVPTLESFRPMAQRAIERQFQRVLDKEFKHYKLTREQLLGYKEDGYILLKDLLSEDLKKDVVSWVDDIQSWPEEAGKHMCYYEDQVSASGEKTRMLCRTENFIPYHEQMRKLLVEEGPITDVLEQLMNEKSVLFKEKVNYKLAGGGGFPAHQDAPAFTSFGQRNHLTVNVAIDEATPENGCLQVAAGHHKKGLFAQDPVHHGLSKESEESLGNWADVPLSPGDVLIFSSWLPHRSGGNTSDKSRRALYVTVNGETDGDFREDYYVTKRAEFPPSVEREEGKDYSEAAKIFNLATPITS